MSNYKVIENLGNATLLCVPYFRKEDDVYDVIHYMGTPAYPQTEKRLS